MIERLDDEFLVCDASRGIALQITGETAEVLRRFQDTGSLEGAPQEIVDDLVKAGILVPLEKDRHLTRRVVISSGVGVVGLGIVALALPNAAAANSSVPVEPASGGDTNNDTSEPEPDTWTISIREFPFPANNDFEIELTVNGQYTFYSWEVIFAVTNPPNDDPLPRQDNAFGYSDGTLRDWTELYFRFTVDEEVRFAEKFRA